MVFVVMRIYGPIRLTVVRDKTNNTGDTLSLSLSLSRARARARARGRARARDPPVHLHFYFLSDYNTGSKDHALSSSIIQNIQQPARHALTSVRTSLSLLCAQLHVQGSAGLALCHW